ncbi:MULTISPECIES: glycosyltransferase [Pseudarthrobacter]|uniref:glycosyltransferase n=1 Tax=Pseudarthrobacter TaxID=1742993 RepID=UPI0013DC5A5E|nr:MULTISPECIES: glycosyltransferase [Pseudarthrobacter]MDP9998807.1 cellulose synthase/poly-beta-1,6-N-acetylglucosamine synthase-like glycosyltransferase [Pseudarthrobacter sulfonivorans]
MPPLPLDFNDAFRSLTGGSVSEFYAEISPYFPLAVAGVIVWGLWLYRFILSHRAGPIITDFRASTSVVVPSFHEDPEILMSALESWRAQKPDEIIVVLDVEDLDAYHRITALADETIRPVLFHHVGKRSALGVGMRMARFDILVLTDSDTWWEPGLLANVQMPFADPAVGGVGTHQTVYQRDTSVWRRIADWLVNVRYLDYVPAMGRAGAVPCISGRTAVYRRSAVMGLIEHLENEYFMGRRCISGDDGRLTWLVLASGYKTVHQSSARALSMFPASFRAFMKQRIRWSRNSYRCYLTAAAKGWLWRVPFVTKVTVLQIILTPLTMGLTMFYLIFNRLDPTPFGVAAAVCWLLLGRGIRGISHLRRHPKDILILPVLAVTVILVALPIKLYAFATMNRQGWLTRHADTLGGDGQDAASLSTGEVAA